MCSVSEISILLVGNTERSEFRSARGTLDGFGRVVIAADVEAAETALARRRIEPDVIVVAQSYPGEFSHRAIDRLRRAAPLSRVLGLLGSWCEGEFRSGEPWPAVVRIYWHQWPPRCNQQFARMLRGECCEWGLPVTATEEERLLLGTEEPAARREGLIAIHTRPYEMEDWLSAVLGGRGYSTVWLRPQRPAHVEGARAAVFDGSDCREAELEELSHLAATLAPAPVVALLDFPRIEQHDRAIAAGAAAVVSKPLYLGDLFWELDRVLGG